MEDFKKKILENLTDSNVIFSQYEDKDFLIFDSWDEVESLETFIKSIDEDESLDSILDYSWGFSDEYSTCSDCYNVIRTSPDCYFWQPDFDINDGGIYCSSCMDENEYIEARINQNRLVNEDLVDLDSNGWKTIDIDFDNGFHHGMNSDPNAIIALLAVRNVDVIFTGQPSQFYIDFNAWVKKSDHYYATKVLQHNDTDLPYDIATEMSKALSGKNSDYIKMETYEISQEDFIEGKFPK